jgi:hypothetical protein
MTEPRQLDISKPEDALAFLDQYVGQAIPPAGASGSVVASAIACFQTLAKALADAKAEHEALETIKAEQAAKGADHG